MMNADFDSPPFASIIIVSWNAKRYLEECLTSLRAVTEIPIEIIVVDNASSDGSPQMVEEKFPEVCLIQSPVNGGFSKGNNIGIARSRGKYLCLVNSDVNVPPGCVNELIAFMEANPDIGMAGPRWLAPGGQTQRSSMRFPTVGNTLGRALGADVMLKGTPWAGGHLMADFAHDHTRDVEVLNGWFWVVRRTALEQVGLLDEGFFMYGEDIDWSYRFYKAGWRRVFYAGVGATHYGGASSAAAPIRFYIEMQRAYFQYFEKHHGRLSRRVVQGIAALHELVRMAGYGAVYLVKPSGRENTRFVLSRSVAVLRWLFNFDRSGSGFAGSNQTSETRP
jgi:GT2 family glycosyltransferase